MSFIRCSTKVPGQKNASRIYAWHDTGGGIIVTGRSGGEGQDGYLRISFPELHYLASSFLSQLKWYRRPGEGKTATLVRLHRGFFKRFDKEFEQKVQQDHKQFMARMAMSRRKREAAERKMLARLKTRTKTDKVFKARVQEAAYKLLVEQEAKAIMKKKKPRSQTGNRGPDRTA